MIWCYFCLRQCWLMPWIVDIINIAQVITHWRSLVREDDLQCATFWFKSQCTHLESSICAPAQWNTENWDCVPPFKSQCSQWVWSAEQHWWLSRPLSRRLSTPGQSINRTQLRNTIIDKQPLWIVFPGFVNCELCFQILWIVFPGLLNWLQVKDLIRVLLTYISSLSKLVK